MWLNVILFHCFLFIEISIFAFSLPCTKCIILKIPWVSWSILFWNCSSLYIWTTFSTEIKKKKTQTEHYPKSLNSHFKEDLDSRWLKKKTTYLVQLWHGWNSKDVTFKYIPGPKDNMAKLALGCSGRIWYPRKAIVKNPLRLNEIMPRSRKLTLLCLEMNLNLLSCACGVTSRHYYWGMQTVLLQVKDIYKEAYN